MEFKWSKGHSAIYLKNKDDQRATWSVIDELIGWNETRMYLMQNGDGIREEKIFEALINPTDKDKIISEVKMKLFGFHRFR